MALIEQISGGEVKEMQNQHHELGERITKTVVLECGNCHAKTERHVTFFSSAYQNLSDSAVENKVVLQVGAKGGECETCGHHALHIDQSDKTRIVRELCNRRS